MMTMAEWIEIRQQQAKVGQTAEDILRERLRQTELKYQTHFCANVELRQRVAALEARLAALENPPAPTKADPLHRAMKFGAGNHMRVGLIT